MGIPKEVIQQEQAAFQLCDNDKSGCLDWPEVEECEEKFSAVLASTGSPVPTEEDFKSSDLNGNGCLTYEEWEEWVESEMPEDDEDDDDEDEDEDEDDDEDDEDDDNDSDENDK